MRCEVSLPCPALRQCSFCAMYACNADAGLYPFRLPCSPPSSSLTLTLLPCGAQMLTENARAREEAERRIAAQNRRMDHLERARREEEAPLLEKAFQQKVLGRLQTCSCVGSCRMSGIKAVLRSATAPAQGQSRRVSHVNATGHMALWHQEMMTAMCTHVATL